MKLSNKQKKAVENFFKQLSKRYFWALQVKRFFLKTLKEVSPEDIKASLEFGLRDVFPSSGEYEEKIMHLTNHYTPLFTRVIDNNK